MPSKLYFLPGALGRMDYWVPAAELVQYPAEKIHFGWPGFGPTPPEQDVKGIDDLVRKVVSKLDAPSALVAQSMGGIIAIRVALARPDLVTHLVLAATSGGMDIKKLGAQDWRPLVRSDHSGLPHWFIDYHEDLSERLPDIKIPVLLLWGDRDPISPVAVGEKLAALLPQAELHIIPHSDHDLGFTHAIKVAALIDQHLQATSRR